MGVTSLIKWGLKGYTVTAGVVNKKKGVCCNKAVLGSCNVQGEANVWGEFSPI